MEYQLTKHAHFVLAERRIAGVWVERVLAAPALTRADAIDPFLEHRLGRIVEYGDRVLRVILDPSVVPVRVVTAFFDRAMKDAL
jgi:hypothetical protein